MGNLDIARLAKELDPYIAAQIRKAMSATQSSGGGASALPAPAYTEPHVLATTTGLATKHTVSGLTEGQVLKATGAASAAFGQLLHGQLGGIGPNDHHAQLHDIIGGDHSYTGGAALDVFGLSAASTLAKLTPSADVSAGATALLRSNAGAVGIQKITSIGAIDLDSATNQVRILPDNILKSDNYASQVTGWGIDYLGGADFRYVYTDELHAKAFIADLEQALAGGQIISKSVAVLAEDFALPAAGSAATLRVEDLPSASNMEVFVSGDLIRLRKFSRSGGSLAIADAWGVVTAYADGSGANEGTQTWTFTRSAGALAGTATGIVEKDAIVLDYGTSENGYYEVNAIDGIYALNSPYAQTVTWKGHPLSVVAGEGLKVRTRMGNLRGLFSVANEYGFYAGDGSTDADTYIRLSSYTNKINNLPLEWYASGTLRMRADSTHGLRLYSAAIDEDYSRGVRWYTGAQEFGGVYGWNQVAGSGYVAVTMRSVGASDQGAGVSIYSNTAGFWSVSTVGLAAYAPGGTSASIGLTADNNQGFNRTEQIRFIAEYLWVTVAETDFVGTVDITGNLSGSSATFSSYVQADGALYANAGRLSASIDAPFYGYSIETPAGGWARGFNFHNTLDSTLGGFGGFGAGGSITYFWIGNAYNDWGLVVYPATGNTMVSGALSVTGGATAGGLEAPTVKATDGFYRDAVKGSIFVPVTVFNATDSSSSVWAGAARNVGTYTFDVNWSENGTIPADAVAVAVFITGAWAASSNSSYMSVQKVGGPYSVLARAHAPGVGCDTSGIVNLDANGQFTVTISGANATAALVRIAGYFV